MCRAACQNHWKKHWAYVLIWKIFFNNQKDIWSQGRNVESQNFKNRQKNWTMINKCWMLFMKLRWSWCDLILLSLRFDNEQIDRTSLHEKMSLKWLKFEQLGENKSYSLDIFDNNISLVLEFQKFWVLKSKIFGQGSTSSKIGQNFKQ